MPDGQDLTEVNAVRRFNRFYTARIGVLEKRLLQTPYSLTEARVLYELAHRAPCAAVDIGDALGLDAGYLSRLLRRFEDRGLITRTAAGDDGRRQSLALTPAGHEAFTLLDRRSGDAVAGMLADLLPEARARLVGAMAGIAAILDPRAERAAVLVRSHRPGDVGWVIQRHAVLYHEEYGWDGTFEALVAEIGARFIRNFDSAREHCWIAEHKGERVGSVFLVKESETVGRLRMLLVEPAARGLGIGRRLVEECLRFARLARYRKVTLWTNDNLHTARRIYESAGFRLVGEEPHHSFGHDLIGQTWDLDLTTTP